MLVIMNNLLLDNKLGTIFRVTIGACFSLSDAVTDTYVIITYYQSDELVGQAIILLAFIATSTIIQLVVVCAQYHQKKLIVQLREGLYTILMLRPVIDAYRVSMTEEDGETVVDRLTELVLNKIIELATESIPGCVLQLFVWLKNPVEAGSFAMVSIGISALTTGYISAMIACNVDVDSNHRR